MVSGNSDFSSFTLTILISFGLTILSSATLKSWLTRNFLICDSSVSRESLDSHQNSISLFSKLPIYQQRNKIYSSVSKLSFCCPLLIRTYFLSSLSDTENCIPGIHLYPLGIKVGFSIVFHVHKRSIFHSVLSKKIVLPFVIRRP